ncbi:MAG: zf-TFIIB domain-containing protein [Myxococcota bacterium]|nr:zf-TFIIB domain-containing protein [Myxococcota bacterium]
MRQCPKCQVDFQVVRKAFAEIDVCPQCAGVFLDPGEGIATHGADSEASFLVHDGRAQIVRISPYQCPSTSHEPTPMQVYAIGFGEGAIEIDYCTRCTGFFLDAGEGAALDALDATDQVTTTATGARFSAPPAVDNQTVAIAQAQAEGDKGLFETFVTDMFRSAASGLQTMGEMNERAMTERRQRRRRWGY